MSDYPTEYPVAWHDPFNGDTERLAHDVQEYNRKMYQSSDRDPATMDDDCMD